MKKTTSILKTLFILFFAVISLQINAQYISVPGSNLSYEDSATWQGGVMPGSSPNQAITISVNSEVIRTGNLYAQAGVTNIYGYFKVTGEFNSNNDNTIYVRSGGVLEVGSLNNGAPIVVEEGGKLIVENNFTHSNKSITLDGEIIVGGNFGNGVNLKVNNTGVFTVGGDFYFQSGSVEVIGGTFELKGSLTTNNNIKVTEGGSLIIHENLAHNGGNIQIDNGLVIVKGDVQKACGTNIGVDGTLVIGGDFTYSGGLNLQESNTKPDNDDGKIYMTKKPAGTVTDSGNKETTPEQNGFGDLDDLLAEKGDNENIMDWLDKLDMTSSQRKWTGEAGDNDWFNKDNWMPKLLPNSNSEVLIQTGSPIIDNKEGIIRVDKIKIESGASLTLKSGNVLEVKRTFNNDRGEFIIENRYGKNGLSSFLPEGNMLGKVIIKFTIPTNQWYYISTPLESPSKEDIGSDVDLPYKSYIYSYDTKTKAWIKDPSSIIKTEGNLVYYESASKEEIEIEYSGEINHGSLGKTINGKGYYLFGNPYTSPLNWQDAGWKLDKVYGTIWYRTRVNEELAFVTYNRDAIIGARAALYPDGTLLYNEEELALIPPYQSVWIHSKTSTEADPFTLEIKPGFKKNNGSAPTLKSSGIVDEKPNNIIRIVSDNDISRDGAVIYFAENMTTSGEDAGDSYKYFLKSVDNFISLFRY